MVYYKSILLLLNTKEFSFLTTLYGVGEATRWLHFCLILDQYAFVLLAVISSFKIHCAIIMDSSELKSETES